MAMKESFQIWQEGVETFNRGNYEDSLKAWEKITDPSARICYNKACSCLKLNRLTDAHQNLTQALTKDGHMSLAYFQRGTLRLRLNSINDSERDFLRALEEMRENFHIDYKQLGFLGKLYRCEVLFNLAVVKQMQGLYFDAAVYLKKAAECDGELKHKQHIQEAKDQMQKNQKVRLEPFEIPTKIVFTPPKSVTDNLKKREYLGKAKVISASDTENIVEGFDGHRRFEELRRTSDDCNGGSGIISRVFAKPTRRPPPLSRKKSHSLEDLSTKSKTKSDRPRKSEGAVSPGLSPGSGGIHTLLSRSCDIIKTISSKISDGIVQKSTDQTDSHQNERRVPERSKPRPPPPSRPPPRLPDCKVKEHFV